MFSKVDVPKHSGGWIGVDLDGTLAHYEKWDGRVDGNIGVPIPRMVARVLKWIREDRDVRIFTARVSYQGTPAEMMLIREGIENWCSQHLGKVLPITCIKDMHMVMLYDDRCVQIVTNTGMTLAEHEALWGNDDGK
jgi:hypothetical protein